MALGFALKIAGIDYINYAEVSTIKPVDSLKDRTDTMVGLKLRIPFNGNTPVIALPKSGQEIVLLRDPNALQGGPFYEFGGVVQRVTERWWKGNTFEYELRCADYTRWFDRHLVQGVRYPTDLSLLTMDADAMVKAIVSDWANKGGKTWDVSLVDAAPAIPFQQFDFIPPTEAINTIAKLVGYRFDLDYQGRVIFTNADNAQAPIATINCETDFDPTSPGDLELEDAADQCVDVIYVKDAKTKAGTYTQTLGTGDGSKTFFPLGYEPAGLDTTSVTVGGATYSTAGGNLKEENVDGTPGDGQTSNTAYLCLPNWGIRFNVAPGAGVPISATYDYLDIGPAIYRVDDPAQITLLAAREGSSGEYEDVVSFPDMVNVGKDGIIARGQVMLAQRRNKLLGSMVAMNTTGWRAGQYFQLISSRRMGGLNQRMYVMTVEKSILSDSLMAFAMTISSDLYGEMS